VEENTDAGHRPALMAHPQLFYAGRTFSGTGAAGGQEIFRIIKKINDEHATTNVLVEQNANMALLVALYGYVMENGIIVMEGTSQEWSIIRMSKNFTLVWRRRSSQIL
jgi:branched-chain amino acid transport system ATP-binding protein